MSRDAITPTPERIKKAGNRYRAPETSQKAKRPYACVTPTLEQLRDRDRITEDQYRAGDQIRHYHAGLSRPIGIVSSYGDRRYSSTPVSQEASWMLRDEWSVYCYDKLRHARIVIGDARHWEVLLAVVVDDCTVEEAGSVMGVTGVTAKTWLTDALQSLVDSDYAQWRPKP